MCRFNEQWGIQLWAVFAKRCVEVLQVAFYLLRVLPQLADRLDEVVELCLELAVLLLPFVVRQVWEPCAVGMNLCDQCPVLGIQLGMHDLPFLALGLPARTFDVKVRVGRCHLNCPSVAQA